MWQHEGGEVSKETCNLNWEDCKEKIDVVALASKEPILFYDEVRILIIKQTHSNIHVPMQKYVSLFCF